MRRYIGCGIVCCCMFVLAGSNLNKEEYSWVAIDVIFAILNGWVFVHLLVKESRGPLKTLDSETYHVLYQGFETGAPCQLLYDMGKSKFRLAKLDTFPPAGHQEVITVDGQTLLVPDPH